jgi:hypothetical protein
MQEPTTESSCHDPSRRQAIRLLAGGIAALALGGCTPATIVFRAYPEAYRPGSDATDRALLAFIETVVPGLTPAEIRAVAVLRDPFYPLARYADFLASDLDRRAERAHHRLFHALAPAERTAVVQRAFAGDGTTRKLYTGAVFLTQAAVYGGIEDDSAGCRLIGFPGAVDGAPSAEVSYPDTTRFATRGLSLNGNPA